jgi:tetratricopeptide (TPR) repeat protein
VKPLRLVTALTLVLTVATHAQLAISQPTTKLLILPLRVSTPADSAASVALMDAVRDRLTTLARYKVIVVPKAKLCDALKASGFPCDVLLDNAQALLLARLLNVNAYTSGTLERPGNALAARVRVVDVASSGFSFAFSETAATSAALADSIAAQLNTIVRAGEYARDCLERRQRGQFNQAPDAARKALAIEPNLTDAHLCMATVYEAQRMPPDSLIAAALRATRGDSLNARAWETIARGYLTKADTAKAVDAFTRELGGDPQNTQLRVAVAELLHQQKQYQRAIAVLDDGLSHNQDQKLIALKSQICIEGQLWRCVLEGFRGEAAADSTKLGDSTFVKAAIGAAQQIPDTQQMLYFSRAAVRRFPRSPDFWKVLGSAYQLKGQPDSALWAEKQALAADPSDINASLLVAKALVDRAVFDTLAAKRLKGDTAALRRLRAAYGVQLDSATPYLTKAIASSDSLQRLSAAITLLTGGSKLAGAAAYDRAYPWLEQALQLVAQRGPEDTLGARQQIRLQASFWYGVSSVQPLFTAYGTMAKSKDCGQAKAVNDWIARAKQALIYGARIHPPTVNTMLQNLVKIEAIMPQVKKQFKCTNF